jgi:hypothetical protein
MFEAIKAVIPIHYKHLIFNHTQAMALALERPKPHL